MTAESNLANRGLTYWLVCRREGPPWSGWPSRPERGTGAGRGPSQTLRGRLRAADSNAKQWVSAFDKHQALEASVSD